MQLNAYISNNTCLFLIDMQQQQQPPPQQNFQNQIWSNKIQHPANVTAQIDIINAQQMKLREQICTSENNLSAQHKVLINKFTTGYD
jgi:hypothetical protein